MNSRDRVITALERKEPDRVPILEWVIDEGVMDSLLPGCDYFAFNEWIGLNNVGLNRSSWSRDNVDYVDKEKGLFRDSWGVIRASAPKARPFLSRVPSSGLRMSRPTNLRIRKLRGRSAICRRSSHATKGRRRSAW